VVPFRAIGEEGLYGSFTANATHQIDAAHPAASCCTRSNAETMLDGLVTQLLGVDLLDGKLMQTTH
jgi:hypothetical protein